jgi:serine kinase of HPr protein (carbohydrate metabolism regulator)
VVALNGRGVLLRGPPGAGKSDLALRLIDRGARLVADDRVELSVRRGRLIAGAPPPLAGLIEARGLGVVSVPHCKAAEIVLVVDLVKPERVERMPGSDRGPDRCVLAGLSLPRLSLAPFEATAPVKLRLALAQAASCRQARIRMTAARTKDRARAAPTKDRARRRKRKSKP